MSRIVSKEEFLDVSQREVAYSQWLAIDQYRIDTFADATNDEQFIHVDVLRAAKTPMGCTIAHGFLTLSLLSHLTEDIFVLPPNVTQVYNYGLDSVRFLAPVRVDREVRAKVEPTSVEEKKPGQYRVQLKVTMEIKGGEKPALVADWIVMVFTNEGEMT